MELGVSAAAIPLLHCSHLLVPALGVDTDQRMSASTAADRQLNIPEWPIAASCRASSHSGIVCAPLEWRECRGQRALA